MFNALLPYYGCKRQSALRIGAFLGKHTAYWDVFCASCSVLFAKEPSRIEVVNDLHGGVVNLARVVANDNLAPLLFDKLSRTAFCEPLYHEMRSRLEEGISDPLEWAYSYLVVSWQGQNGFTGTQKENRTSFCKRFGTGGGDPATRFRNMVAHLPSWWERLRGVTILQSNAFDLLKRIADEPGTVIYCDPPYYEKTLQYRHDFTKEDHEKLAKALNRFQKARVVVSYYDHEIIDEFYVGGGFMKFDIETRKTLSLSMGKTESRAPEILWVKNYEEDSGGGTPARAGKKSRKWVS
jgi:DNA adenine methylase